MIRIAPGDILSFELAGVYFHCIALSKIKLFGGLLAVAVSSPSPRPLSSTEVVTAAESGFLVVIDFIFANREARLQRLGKTQDTERFVKFPYFKQCHETNKKGTLWFISDHNMQELRRQKSLNREEACYPFLERIDDTVLANRVKSGWRPEKDIRVTGAG